MGKIGLISKSFIREVLQRDRKKNSRHSASGSIPAEQTMESQGQRAPDGVLIAPASDVGRITGSGGASGSNSGLNSSQHGQSERVDGNIISSRPLLGSNARGADGRTNPNGQQPEDPARSHARNTQVVNSGIGRRRLAPRAGVSRRRTQNSGYSRCLGNGMGRN